MDKQRIPGFRWAMMIFIFYIISYALPTILKDFQGSVPYKSFVFDLSFIAPFVAVFICLIIFGSRRLQLSGLKFTFGLDTIVRFLLALIIPLVIFIVAMTSFNVFANSFILLQAEDLSVSITTVIIGQLIMAFLVEFAFRSYLQNIVENRVYNLFASIIVGFLYALWNVNLSFGLTFAMYSFLYGFAFSIIVGELIRGMRGRTIYIATAFHFMMSFGLVFLFNEELGNIFAMKIIAYSTVAVGLVYLILSMIIRAILYFFTRRNFEEIEDNNYMDHLNDEDEIAASNKHNESSNALHNEETAATATTGVDEQAVTEDTPIIESNDNETHQMSDNDDVPITENTVHHDDTPITEDSARNDEIPVTEDVPTTQNDDLEHHQVEPEDSDAFESTHETQTHSNTDNAHHESKYDRHSNLTHNVANDTETTTSSKHVTNEEQASQDNVETDETHNSNQSDERDNDERDNNATSDYHRTSFLTKLKKRNRR
ncbi:MAG TPA: CPBP family intramembrane metalloprotease [Staphylococcus kloosii]|uniref:CPBP family intramembrane metalloprotease n=1 Tax=Staphylococcus kloosii TaxID=29384 RepID=A0A921GZ92_9STAP|nr:CPBP family glutamic-type intramembrane protease [Staphylococcus kloosii]HJF67899.1 CPBP family intramembrane metalloprotease [Staphylococcus kloosii]